MSAKDVEGLPTDTLSKDWPPAKKRWTRTCEVELMVYAKDAEIVSLEVDPALDPVVHGNLAVERIVVRSKGDKFTATISWAKNLNLPVPVSGKLILRLADREYPLGDLGMVNNGNSQSWFGPAASNEPIVIDRLDPQVREAEIRLAPEPKVVERSSQVTRIWGKEIIFKHVPLVRHDLPGAKPEPTDAAHP